jgi:hypothetical protein
MSSIVGSKYEDMEEAAESLIAQLYLQGNLTTPRREKIIF